MPSVANPTTKKHPFTDSRTDVVSLAGTHRYGLLLGTPSSVNYSCLFIVKECRANLNSPPSDEPEGYFWQHRLKPTVRISCLKMSGLADVAVRSLRF